MSGSKPSETSTGQDPVRVPRKTPQIPVTMIDDGPNPALLTKVEAILTAMRKRKKPWPA